MTNTGTAFFGVRAGELHTLPKFLDVLHAQQRAKGAELLKAATLTRTRSKIDAAKAEVAALEVRQGLVTLSIDRDGRVTWTEGEVELAECLNLTAQLSCIYLLRELAKKFKKTNVLDVRVWAGYELQVLRGSLEVKLIGWRLAVAGGEVVAVDSLEVVTVAEVEAVQVVEVSEVEARHAAYEASVQADVDQRAADEAARAAYRVEHFPAAVESVAAPAVLSLGPVVGELVAAYLARLICPRKAAYARGVAAELGGGAAAVVPAGLAADLAADVRRRVGSLAKKDARAAAGESVGCAAD